jgi:hypothetical protein
MAITRQRTVEGRLQGLSLGAAADGLTGRTFGGLANANKTAWFSLVADVGQAVSSSSGLFASAGSRARRVFASSRSLSASRTTVTTAIVAIMISRIGAGPPVRIATPIPATSEPITGAKNRIAAVCHAGLASTSTHADRPYHSARDAAPNHVMRDECWLPSLLTPDTDNARDPRLSHSRNLGRLDVA